MRCLVVPLFALLFYTAGCRDKQSGSRELASDLRELASHAAEVELFIDQVRAGKITTTFARSHAAYLADQSKKAGEDAANEQPAADIENAFSDYRQQRRLLSQEMSRLPLSLDDPSALLQTRAAVESVRNRADQLLLAMPHTL